MSEPFSRWSAPEPSSPYFVRVGWVAAAVILAWLVVTVGRWVLASPGDEYCAPFGSCYIYATASADIPVQRGVPTRVFFFDAERTVIGQRVIEPELTPYVVDRPMRSGQQGWVRVER